MGEGLNRRKECLYGEEKEGKGKLERTRGRTYYERLRKRKPTREKRKYESRGDEGVGIK